MSKIPSDRKGLSKDEKESLFLFHETFAGRIEMAVGRKLRRYFGTQMIGVDLVGANDFMAEVQEKTFLGAFKIEGMGTHLLLDIGSPIMFSLLDGFLRKRKKRAESPSQPDKEERRGASELMRIVIGQFRETWKSLFEFEPSFERLLSRPPKDVKGPAGELLLRLSLEIEFADVTGLVNLGIPWEPFKPFLPEIMAEFGPKGRKIPVLSDAQLDRVKDIHEEFSRNVELDLSDVLKTRVKIDPISYDHMEFREFIRVIYNPTFLVYFRMKGIAGAALLDMNTELAFRIVDILLGRKENRKTYFGRMTGLEKRPMKALSRKILDHLRAAWKGIVDLKPVIERIESTPRFLQVFPPSQPCFCMRFQVRIARRAFIMSLCIPLKLLQPIVPPLKRIRE